MNRAIKDLPALACQNHLLETSQQRLGWLTPVPENQRHDRAALWSRLRQDGYLFLRDAIPAEAALEFRAYYFAALQNSGLLEADSDPVLGVASRLEFDRAMVRKVLFDEIVPSATYANFCESIRDYFAWLFDAPVHLHQRKLIRHARTDETWVTPAHYDLVYLREGTKNLLSAWIPLGDCPAERGGLTYLENSHKHFALRDEAEGNKLRAEHISYDLPALANQLKTRWLIADYQAGDMVIHSPYLVHASLNNTDPNNIMRLSTDIRYQPAFENIDPRWQNHWHENDGL
jgi:hypothetical protein